MKIINIHIMKKITFSILFVWLSLSLWAARQPEFSTAGFFRLDNSGREVYSMNPAWRFHKNLMIKTGRLSPCRTVSNICRPRRVVVSITKGRSGIASILRPMPL